MYFVSVISEGESVDIVVNRNDLYAGMDTARLLYDRFDKHWTGDAEDQGMHRPGYSPEEQEAIDICAEQAKAMNMEIMRDLAGNTFFNKPGADRNKAAVMMGSHVDAVPHGGKYDGTAGVVSAMAVARTLYEKGITPPQDFVVSIWRNEESPWFGKYALGSHLATGALGSEFLEKTQKGSGKTLATCMDDLGLDSNKLAAALDAGQVVLPVDTIGGFYEAHIEQGTVLKDMNMDLGLVTAIRGNVRFPDGITFCGEAGHTGSVPQRRRKDAHLAACHFGTMFDRYMNSLWFMDSVHSLPRIIEHEKASNTTIPKEVTVYPEVRSTNPMALRIASMFIARAAKSAARYKKCTLADLNPVISMPSRCAALLTESSREIASQLSLNILRMPSGAGHDSTVLSNAGVPSQLLFVQQDYGHSHRPDEDMGGNPFSVRSPFASAVLVQANSACAPVYYNKRNNENFREKMLANGAEVLWSPKAA
jgi:N-carbamoyl-L-amino-acid hydrolase